MDTFLLTYQVGTDRLLYDISSGIQPLSIRDQMFRGHIIIERALAEGLIHATQSNPLLIVGAGVAGSIAALTAVSYQVPTVLVEAETPLIRQIHCRSRFVCPTQYDWPAPHWLAGKYPWKGKRLPLKWASNSASATAAAWASSLNLVQEHKPELLRIVPRTKFLRLQVIEDEQGERSIEAYFAPQMDQEPLRCSMVVSCAGIGVERHWVPNEKPSYVGYGFWQLDEFGKPDLGLGGKRPKVLISGGGDGALQDFLRVTTGLESAKLIYTGAIEEEYRATIEREIYIAEDYAQRAYVWGKEGELDHSIQRRLHDDHQEVVNKLYSDSKLRKKIEKGLDGVVANMNKRLERIKLAYPCNHFSSCYALNRFLALLIAQYIRSKFGYEPLRPRAKILNVTGVGQHHCLGKPPLCHGEEHEIEYAEANCDTFLRAGDDPNSRRRMEDGPFNVVIIRHGIRLPIPPLGNSPSAAPPRQVIPYYIPWD